MSNSNFNMGTSLTDNSDAVQNLLNKLKPQAGTGLNDTTNFNNLPPAPDVNLYPLQGLDSKPQQTNPILEAIQRLGTIQPNPDVDKFKQTLSEVPQLSQQTHIPWYRKLASIPIGISEGTQAQQSYLNQPYTRQYQDWANKVAAQEKGLTVPTEIQNLQNKPVLDMLRAQGDVSRMKIKNKANTDLTKHKIETLCTARNIRTRRS